MAPSYVRAVNRGVSLVELVATLLVVAVLSAIVVPRLGSMLDRVATEAAAAEITMALAATRHAAVTSGRRARLLIAPDSLRLDRLDANGWSPRRRWPGPGAWGVALGVSNPQVTYGPSGIGWGLSNTSIVLLRGSQKETIVTSRVGRVKRG